MLTKIKAFWMQSYYSDRKAFACEIVSFVLTVGASLLLAVTADEPDMTLVYPGFFIGALFGAVASYRRGLAWPLMLTSYFSVINVFGYGVAIGWW